MNYYETLGIEPTATPDEIKAAYRRAAAAAHPDREGGSTERMQEVNAAYTVLSDPERRELYNRVGDENAQREFQLVQKVFCELLEAYLSGVGDMRSDVVAWLREQAAGIASQAEHRRAAEDRKLRDIERRAARVIGVPLLEELAAGAKLRIAAAIEQAERDIRISGKLVDMLKDAKDTRAGEQSLSPYAYAQLRGLANGGNPYNTGQGQQGGCFNLF